MASIASGLRSIFSFGKIGRTRNEIRLCFQAGLTSYMGAVIWGLLVALFDFFIYPIVALSEKTQIIFMVCFLVPIVLFLYPYTGAFYDKHIAPFIRKYGITETGAKGFWWGMLCILVLQFFLFVFLTLFVLVSISIQKLA